MLVSFCKQHPVFRRRRWFQGRVIRRAAGEDIAWFRPDGVEMSDEDWHVGFAKSVGVFVNGDAIPSPDIWGRRIVDDSFYLVFNAHSEPVEFVMPPKNWGRKWRRIIDTGSFAQTPSRSLKNAGDKVTIKPRSLLVMCRAT
jgi:glycogen operon protein